MRPNNFLLFYAMRPIPLISFFFLFFHIFLLIHELYSTLFFSPLPKSQVCLFFFIYLHILSTGISDDEFFILCYYSCLSHSYCWAAFVFIWNEGKMGNAVDRKGYAFWFGEPERRIKQNLRWVDGWMKTTN